jgi:hypothetical protein
MPDTGLPGLRMTFEPRDAYLYIKVSSPVVDPDIAKTYLHAVVDEINRVGPTRVMLVRDIPVGPPGRGTFKLLYSILGSFAHIRFAIVSPHSRLIQSLGFIMFVAKKAGVDAQVFQGEDEAERWLLQAESN